MFRVETGVIGTGCVHVMQSQPIICAMRCTPQNNKYTSMLAARVTYYMIVSLHLWL